MTDGDYKIRPFPLATMGTDSQEGGINSMMPGNRPRGTWPYPSQYPTYSDTVSTTPYNPYQSNFTPSQAEQPIYPETNTHVNTMFWTPSTGSLNHEVPNADLYPAQKDRVYSQRHFSQKARPYGSGPFRDPTYVVTSFENNPQFPTNNSSMPFHSYTPIGSMVTHTPNSMSSYQAYVPVPSMSMPPQIYSNTSALIEQQLGGFDNLSMGSIHPITPTSLTQELIVRMRMLYTSLFNLYIDSNKAMSQHQNSQIFQVYYSISMTMWYLGKNISEIIRLLNKSITSSTLPLSIDANLGLTGNSLSTSHAGNPRIKGDSVTETEPKATMDAFASVITHTKEFAASDAGHNRIEGELIKRSTESQIAELESTLRDIVKRIYGEFDVDTILENAGLASLISDQCSPNVAADYYIGAGPQDDLIYSRDVLLAMDKIKLVEKIEAQNAIIDNLRHTFNLISTNITTLSRAAVPSNAIGTTDELSNNSSSVIDTLMKQLSERTIQLATAQKRLLAAEAELKCLKEERECSDVKL